VHRHCCSFPDQGSPTQSGVSDTHMEFLARRARKWLRAFVWSRAGATGRTRLRADGCGARLRRRHTAPAGQRVDHDGPLLIDDHRVQLQQLEVCPDKELTGGNAEARGRLHVEPRPPPPLRATPQCEIGETKAGFRRKEER
jgi:hypothetical protein